MIHEANRLKRLPPYLFAVVDNKKREVLDRGVDVIDLSMGSPDLPAPKHAIEELCKQARVDGNQRYSRWDGDAERQLRKAIADWYMEKFGVSLDPEEEVVPLIGSKEGIAHLCLGFLNNDDITLVPNPSYPVHFNGVIMAGGILYNIPLSQENNYMPNLKTLSPEVVKMAKLLLISYPHNPTTQVATLEYFQEIVDWAKKRDIIVAHDFAYSDIVFDGYKAPSFLLAKGAKDIGIEFHTLSKSYNMSGWRLGFCVGNKNILKTLAKTKNYIDFGIFKAVQYAAIKTLLGPQDIVKETVETYRKRRDLFVDGLNQVGWKVDRPKATFYIWAHIPLKYSTFSAMEFTNLLLDEAGIAVAPGTGFGEYGEGYVRFALVEKEERLKMAIERLKKMLELHP